MQHTIPIDQLGPTGQLMARAVESCVHCGFCLPTCPTYVALGQETNSPRGRIFLMKSALEGNLTNADVQPFVDRCLGCLACTTACPSGVSYNDLLMPYRALSEKKHSRPWSQKIAREMAHATLPHPSRFRLAARAGRLARPFRGLLPASMAAMLTLLPSRLPSDTRVAPGVFLAEGPRRGRVALLAGCVQQVLAPDINAATLRVLQRAGIEVVVPGGQGCCGALMIHTGAERRARELARHNLRVFPRDVDAIVTTAAGCGSGMQEYRLLFKGMPEEETARDFAARVRDVSEVLADLVTEVAPLPQPLKVAYHDACHLAHARGVVEAPRRLLRAIPNLTLLEVPEGELCCGSAGTYNIDQPELADAIGRRKAENIAQTGADVVAAGNIGCLVQIRAHLATVRPIPVLHTIEIVDRAWRGVAVL